MTKINKNPKHSPLYLRSIYAFADCKGNHLKQQQKPKEPKITITTIKEAVFFFFFFSVPSNTLMGIVLSETVMYKLLNQTSSKCEF